MKLIAHRGASLERQENTAESLIFAARLGADAVECDPRVTKDGVVVLFHDDNLMRMAGDDRHINAITYDEMKEALAKRGLEVTTLNELFENYNSDMPILLDLITCEDGEGLPHLVADDDFFMRLAKVPLNLICGIHTIEEAKSAAKFFPAEQILAFIPNENSFEEFYKAGAGIIRLWEQWLEYVKPADVKAKCSDAEVYIMSCRPETGLNGTPESLRFLNEIGADGVLLNNIRMAVSIIKEGRQI